MGRELKLLLDTHTLLYALVEPERLSPQARELLTNPSNRRLVSVASLWEIAIKHQLGRLPQGVSYWPAIQDGFKTSKPRNFRSSGPTPS